jgi:hypothetical protein
VPSGVFTEGQSDCSTGNQEDRSSLLLPPRTFVGMTFPGVVSYNVSCTGLGMPVRT